MIFRSKPVSADRLFDDEKDRIEQIREVTGVYKKPGVARFHFQLGSASNTVGRFTDCAVDLDLQDIIVALQIIVCTRKGKEVTDKEVVK